MIDLRTETLMSLSAAQAWLKARGVNCSRNTLYRWADLGKLETARIGGRHFTSVEALQRMSEGEAPRTKQARKTRPRFNQKSHDEAMAYLRSKGFKV